MLLGLLFLFIGQLAGSTVVPIATKIGLQFTSPLLFVFLRFLFASILFFPFFVFSKRKKLGFSDYKNIMILALLLFFNVSLFTVGIQFTTVLMSQILYGATPIVVGILAQIFLHETLTKEKIIGLAIALSGMCFLFYQSATQQEHLTFGTPLGNVIIIGAMLGYSGWVLYSRALQTSQKYTSSQLSFFTFIFIALYMLFMLPIDKYLSSSHMFVFSNYSLLYSILVGFGSVILYFFIQLGIKYTNAFTASLFQYIGPFLTGIFSTIILHEKVTSSLFFGGILIIGGVFYATSFNYVMRLIKKV
jgi:drug/metabolite transporter (DMT)-like permease